MNNIQANTKISPRTAYKMILKDYPDVMNVVQMCDALGGISLKTAYKILGENKIESIKVGRAYRITKVGIIQYLLNIND